MAEPGSDSRKAEKGACGVAEDHRSFCFRETGLLYDLPGLRVAYRKGIVRAEHDVVCPGSLDQELEDRRQEHQAVEVDPLESFQRVGDSGREGQMVTDEAAEQVGQ